MKILKAHTGVIKKIQFRILLRVHKFFLSPVECLSFFVHTTPHENTPQRAKYNYGIKIKAPLFELKKLNYFCHVQNDLIYL